MKIVTEHIFPPIPIRSMDWIAYDADTYDADCDQDGYFSSSPVGHGSTEAEAVADLKMILEDGMDNFTAMDDFTEEAVTTWQAYAAMYHWRYEACRDNLPIRANYFSDVSALFAKMARDEMGIT